SKSGSWHRRGLPWMASQGSNPRYAWENRSAPDTLTDIIDARWAGGVPVRAIFERRQNLLRRGRTACLAGILEGRRRTAVPPCCCMSTRARQHLVDALHADLIGPYDP